MTRSNYRTPEGERAAMAFYDRVIAAWPVPLEARTVETGVGPTYVLAFGEPGGEPLVLLHGGTGNSTAWAGEAATYAKRFRVYAVDLPGEAGKSTPARPTYEGPAFADWLRDVIDGLGVQRASVVGLSLGGWVALRFAAAYPHRVRRMVLISPGGVRPARLSFVLRAIVYRAAPWWGFEAITRMVFAPLEPPAGTRDTFVSTARDFRPRGGNLPTVSDAELRRVGAPVLLIGGAQDRLLDMPGTEARLRSLLPRFDCVLVPGMGHVVVGAGERAVAFLDQDEKE